jgi:heat shock protein HslJ
VNSTAAAGAPRGVDSRSGFAENRRLRAEGRSGMNDKRGAVLMAAGLLLAGCGGGNVAGPQGGSALVGPVWRASRVEGQPLLQATTISAEFTADGRVAGDAGCNRYTGSARAEASGSLSVGPLASTRMACAQGVMDQEARYLAALGSAAGTTLLFTSR